MANIKIMGVEGSITVPNAMGRKIARDKKELPAAVQKTMWIQIGQWEGYMSNVRSITYEVEPIHKLLESDLNRPLTDQEIKNKADMMARIRKNLEEKGIINRLDV